MGAIEVMLRDESQTLHLSALGVIAGHVRDARDIFVPVSSIDMYNNDVGKESAQKFMKQTGDLKAATLYFAS